MHSGQSRLEWKEPSHEAVAVFKKTDDGCLKEGGGSRDGEKWIDQREV